MVYEQENQRGYLGTKYLKFNNDKNKSDNYTRNIHDTVLFKWVGKRLRNKLKSLLKHVSFCIFMYEKKPNRRKFFVPIKIRSVHILNFKASNAFRKLFHLLVL